MFIYWTWTYRQQNIIRASNFSPSFSSTIALVVITKVMVESILSWLTVDVVISDTMGISRISSLGIQKLEAHWVDKNNYFIWRLFPCFGLGVVFPSSNYCLVCYKDAKWCSTVNTLKPLKSKKKSIWTLFSCFPLDPDFKQFSVNTLNIMRQR